MAHTAEATPTKEKEMPQKSLAELLDRNDPMWRIIQEWLKTSANRLEVLSVARDVAEATLLALQVTTRSPLGAMAFETGGIFVDSGWLRLLGSSSARMRDGLLAWNGNGENSIKLPDALIVAHDVLGGFFAVNLGAFGPGPHEVFYFAPETLKWQTLGLSYADFLGWAVCGEVATFYASQRWPHWEQEVLALTGDQGISVWPMPWERNPAMGKRSRRVVPQRELWFLHNDLSQQVAKLPPGTHVSLRFTDDSY